LNDDIAPSNHPIGVLTTTERNNWADLRNYLIKLGNEESLRIIDDSLMMIALDDETPGSDPIPCVKQYLHSDGVNRLQQ
jgi:carnitine O-palmitoyltransferase 2